MNMKIKLGTLRKLIREVIEDVAVSNEEPEDYNTGEVLLDNDGGTFVFQNQMYKDYRNLPQNQEITSAEDWQIPRMKQMISDIQSVMPQCAFIYDGEIMGADLMTSQQYIDYLQQTISELESNKI